MYYRSSRRGSNVESRLVRKLVEPNDPRRTIFKLRIYRTPNGEGNRFETVSTHLDEPFPIHQLARLVLEQTVHCATMKVVRSRNAGEKVILV